MGVPILFLRQRFIYTVVKVLVVGEDDMSADIVELDSSLVLHMYSPMGRFDHMGDVQSPLVLYL